MSETVDLTPEGCTTPEGIRRVNQMKDKFEDATARVANLLTDVLGHDPVTIRTRLKTWNEHGTIECDEDDLKVINDALNDRREAQEELLRAVAGVPPRYPAIAAEPISPWTPNPPTQEGFHWVKAVGQITGREIITIVFVSCRAGNWEGRWDAETFSTTDRSVFTAWGRQPITPLDHAPLMGGPAVHGKHRTNHG